MPWILVKRQRNKFKEQHTHTHTHTGTRKNTRRWVPVGSDVLNSIHFSTFMLLHYFKFELVGNQENCISFLSLKKPANFENQAK